MQVQNGFFILTNEKKATILAPDVPSATAISFVYEKRLIVIKLISLYALALTLSGKLGANLPK